MISQRGASNERLRAERQRSGERLVELFAKHLRDLGHESGFDVAGLAATAAAALDRIANLDTRLADHEVAQRGPVPSPTDELRNARATLKTLAWCLALLAPGQVEAGQLLRAGIEAQIQRIRRSRAELDRALR